jgi:hypothetical protein
VSFGTFERKVRNSSLAYGQRIEALAGCVERYGPLGFHGTFEYLEHVAGQFRHDEAALLRAMDALSSSRDLWLVELNAYAEQRRSAKRKGRRNAPVRDLDRSRSARPGEARNAATFALRYLVSQNGRPSRRPHRTRWQEPRRPPVSAIYSRRPNALRLAIPTLSHCSTHSRSR